METEVAQEVVEEVTQAGEQVIYVTPEAMEEISEQLADIVGKFSEIIDIGQFMYTVSLWFCGLLGLTCGLLLVLILKKD